MFGIPDFFPSLILFLYVLFSYFFGILDKFHRTLLIYALFLYYSWNSSQFVLECCSSMPCFLIFPWNSELFFFLNMVPLCPISILIFGIPEKFWSNFSFLYEGGAYLFWNSPVHIQRFYFVGQSQDKLYWIWFTQDSFFFLSFFFLIERPVIGAFMLDGLLSDVMDEKLTV